MINRFMISVAAATLIAGTGFANAQGTGMSREAPSGMSREAPSGTQQAAPSSDRTGAAPSTNRDAPQPDSKQSAQSEPKSSEPNARTGGKNQRADDTMQKSDTQKSKSMNSENDNKAGDSKDMKAEGRDRNKNAETKSSADKSQADKSQTVGQAGAGAKLSGDQRTRISSVIKEQHVQSVTNVNFSVSVGTRVPRDVSFRPLPAEVVTIYPEWRGYNFVLVEDRIVVIDPGTYEIVAVIDG